MTGFLRPRPLEDLDDPEARLIGRAREAQWLERFLLDSPGGVAVVAGEPGIGKTTLIGAVVARLKGAVVVDDADHLDGKTIEQLAGRGGVVFAARTGGHAIELLEGAERLELRGLDRESAAGVLARHAADPIARDVADRLIDATSANPMALRELASNLTADQLAGRRPLPHPLAIGPRLAEALADRAPDPEEPAGLALLTVAASFGRREVVVDAMSRLGVDRSHVERLRSARLISADEVRIGLRHPLMAAAVYHRACSRHRQMVHRALAEANAELGDREGEAWHLTACTTGADGRAAARITAGAHLSRRRGAVGSAAEAFAAAARISPDAVSRAERILEAAELWLAVGRTEAAELAGQELLTGQLPDHLRAGAAYVRGRALLAGGAELEGRRFLLEQAGRFAALEPRRAAQMAAAASASALRSGRFDEAAEAAERALRWAGPASGPASGAVPEGVRAVARVAAGAAALVRAEGGRDQAGVRELVAVCETDGLLVDSPMVAVNAPLAMVWGEYYGPARRVLERFEADARAAGAPGILAPVLVVKAVLEQRMCHYRDSEAAASEALELAELNRQPSVAVYASTVLASVEAVLGRAERCRRRCQSLLERPGVPGPMRASAVATLGLLELGEGHPDRAVHWMEVRAGQPDSIARNDPSFMMWKQDLVEAYHETGQTERALALLAEMEEQAHATDHVRATAAVKRSRALLTTDDDQALALFDEVLREYRRTARTFAQARTQLARARRTPGPEAAVRLSDALALFEHIGADGWARRTRGYLQGTAGGSTLSAVERQVALARGMGGSEKDIADATGLGVEGVEAHLASALSKLGVSAEDLAATVPDLVALGAEEDKEPAAAPPTPVGSTIRMLGGFSVDAPGAVNRRPAGAAGVAIKLVALAGRLPVEELIDQLWPEADPAAGRNRLRTLLARIRQACGPILVREGAWVALAPGVETDVQRFDRAAVAAVAARSGGGDGWGRLAALALELYGGELLPAERHVARTAGPRERLRQRQLELLGLVVEDAAARGDLDRAVGVLEDIIAVHRHDEAPYLRAASLLAAAGRRAEASGVLLRARSALAEIGLALSRPARDLEASLADD